LTQSASSPTVVVMVHGRTLPSYVIKRPLAGASSGPQTSGWKFRVFGLWVVLIGWVAFLAPVSAQSRSGPITLKAAKVRVPFPKTWLSAEPNVYLPQSVHWFHPAGARIVITTTPKKTTDTLATWTAQIKAIATSRKITLDATRTVQALGAEALRITGRTRTHVVEFFFFFHNNQVVLVNFTCEAKSITACVVAPDYERVIAGLEAL